jgi:uncharacterized peroxidase-related enzyme
MKAVEQQPTWLPEVEANPQPSPYAELIRVAQNANEEVWQIWNLFAFRPEVTGHLASFTEGVMRSPAPVSSGLRELIAAYTSWTNECEFCWRSHAAMAAELLGSEELVQSVLRDLESSPLPEQEKALLRFARKITLDLPSMSEADIAALRDLGWNDEAIYFTISVVALFNFYNRWVTTSGVHRVSDEAHRFHGKRVARSGYEPKNRLAGIRQDGH